MTVNAIHASLAAGINLLLRKPATAIVIFNRISLPIPYSHPGNYLTMVVRRDVVNRIGNIHVPVNSRHLARRRTAAADVEQHSSLSQRVLFVVSVVIEDF